MSVFYQVVEAVASEVQTAVSGFGTPVELRRRNVWVHGDPLPCVIVSPADTEEVADEDFTGQTTWVYPVNVNLVWPDDRVNDFQVEAQLYLNIREAIRDRLYYPLLTDVAQVWDVQILGTKPFTLPDQRGTYSSTGWIVKYKAKEMRRMA